MEGNLKKCIKMFLKKAYFGYVYNTIYFKMSIYDLIEMIWPLWFDNVSHILPVWCIPDLSHPCSGSVSGYARIRRSTVRSNH